MMRHLLCCHMHRQHAAAHATTTTRRRPLSTNFFLPIASRDRRENLVSSRCLLGSSSSSRSFSGGDQKNEEVPGGTTTIQQQHSPSSSSSSSLPLPRRSISNWKEFSSTWNEVLTRQPKASVATFLASQSTTWLALHITFSSSVLGITVPSSVAAGWMFARVTRRFRRPLNLFVAAGFYQIIPAVADIKVTPLMGIVGDPQTDQFITEKRNQLEKSIPISRTIFTNISKGWDWIQGPVDTYGLALFLSGKFSYLVTMGAATVAIQRGLDLDAMLLSWGIGEALGDAAGSLALSTAANVTFVPIHFLSVVYGVPIMEEWAKKKDKEIRLYDLELERQRQLEQELEQLQQDKLGQQNHGEDIISDNEEKFNNKRDDDEEGRKEEHHHHHHHHSSIDTLSLGLLLWATAIGFYIIRVMGKAATTTTKEKVVYDSEGTKEEEEEEVVAKSSTA